MDITALSKIQISEKQTIYWSNPSYVLVGLMVEKAAGKNYETLVHELGQQLGITFGFGVT
ncbi:MAG: hypothetical protein IPO02_14660 [Bacteroidetes bacterium]|nr:hypothetical protein [Bacteroidota bacterium]